MSKRKQTVDPVKRIGSVVFNGSAFSPFKR